jgi:hypothetical protein
VLAGGACRAGRFADVLESGDIDESGNTTADETTNLGGCGGFAKSRRPDSNRRPLHYEKGSSVAPKWTPVWTPEDIGRRAEIPAAIEALCRTRTGDPFLTIEKSASQRVHRRASEPGATGPQRPAQASVAPDDGPQMDPTGAPPGVRRRERSSPVRPRGAVYAFEKSAVFGIWAGGVPITIAISLRSVSSIARGSCR